MSKTTPISLVEIIKNDDRSTFVVKSAELKRQMPKIEAETIPSCLDKIKSVFAAAHNGETEYDGTSIVWIKGAGDITVTDPNNNIFAFKAPKPGVMGQAA